MSHKLRNYMWLWYCVRCQRAEFHLVKDDALSKDDAHKAVNNGHTPEIKRVFV